MEIVIFIICLVACGAGGWMAAKLRQSKHHTHVLVEQATVSHLSNQINNLKNDLKEKEDEIRNLLTQLSTEQANNSNLEEKWKNQQKERENLIAKSASEFKNLASEIFDAKNKENKSSIGDLIKPLQERIVEFEGKFFSIHKNSIETHATLLNELKSMKDLNVQMTQEARNLTHALKRDTKVQGNWGELILESILDKSGLTKGREYTVQESYVDEEGQRKQPDVIIHLPGDRHIIIDSKVSLTDYERYINSASDEQKNTFLKAHLNSINRHVDMLSKKNYTKKYPEGELDFVFMFIPLESAYLLAIQNAGPLYEKAFKERVVLVSPTLFIPAIQLIKNIWKREYQNRNVIEIARQAGSLHDKFVGLISNLESVGKHMDSSKKSYDYAMNKLLEGRGNLVNKIDTLKKLGAKTEKTLSLDILKKADNENSI